MKIRMLDYVVDANGSQWTKHRVYEVKPNSKWVTDLLRAKKAEVEFQYLAEKIAELKLEGVQIVVTKAAAKYVQQAAERAGLPVTKPAEPEPAEPEPAEPEPAGDGGSS